LKFQAAWVLGAVFSAGFLRNGVSAVIDLAYDKQGRVRFFCRRLFNLPTIRFPMIKVLLLPAVVACAKRNALRVTLAVSLLLPSAAMSQSNTPPQVIVANPIKETVVDWDEYTGRFEAAKTVSLQARVTGYLASIHFREGELVEAGQLLYTIDQRPFRLAVQQAEARLTAAKAASDLAQIEADRAKELVDRNVGAESEQQRAGAAYQEALANVALAESRLAAAELDLEFTEVKSPIDGRISATEADVGDLITGGASAANVLSTIVSVDPIEFVFTASEADFLKYARLNAETARSSDDYRGNKVFVRLQDEETWDRSGEMDFVDNRLDPNSGTITARAVFDNTNGFLQPGLFGKARLVGSGEFEALLIPDEAVVADQSRSIVYVVGDEGSVQAQVIERGAMWRGLRVVRSGLTADQQIVIKGLQRVRPGGKVTPKIEEISMEDGE